MDRWFHLAAVSFTSTLVVVMLGTVWKRLESRAQAAPTVQIAQVATATMSLGMAMSVPELVRREEAPSRVAAPPRELDTGGEEVVEAPVIDWTPPLWFPDATRDLLWTLESMSEADPSHRGFRLQSRGVFVYDLEKGEVLLSVGADERRPVASLTKVISALALVSENPDLDREVCLDSSVRPSWPGAVSRLRSDTCMTGWDLLGAALVRSDNGAAYAFAPVAELPHYPFVARINQVAQDLHMDLSTFSDPSGAEDENLSTARDMTRAIYAASLHPALAPVVSAPFWDVTDTRSGRTRRLLTTDKLEGTPRLDILAAKTGYTDTARYCFSAVLQTRTGRKVALTVIGAGRSRHRWGDVRNILEWLDRGVI